MIGVKCEDKEDRETWQLWLNYGNGLSAPIDPRNQREMETRGYRKAAEVRPELSIPSAVCAPAGPFTCCFRPGISCATLRRRTPAGKQQQKNEWHRLATRVPAGHC